jgi:hypothetical protein
MSDVINWLIPALVGTAFTVMACFKFYGLTRGIDGGADKPFTTRLCGS